MKYSIIPVFIALATFIALTISTNTLNQLLFTTSNHTVIKDTTVISKNTEPALQNILAHTGEALTYALNHHYNTTFCLLADMSVASGKNHLFIYSFPLHTIATAALVAHGSCNSAFLSKARFSNQQGCGCTAYGKYKIANKYNGRFGTAYKLYGLDSSNSHAFERTIVLHSYYGVPEKETYPLPICNSLGCIMVSTGFLKTLAPKIDASQKPVLLWVFY